MVFSVAMNSFVKKIRNLNSRPYSVIYTKLKKIDLDISDLFSFILDGFETIFIAENSLALLIGKSIECNHIFHFFDINGYLISTYKISSKRFHYTLIINKEITRGAKFGSFTHHIQYSSNIINENENLLNDVSLQHRGYTGYRKDVNSGFSFVHGNFGGLYVSNNKIKSLARNRVKHTYTPQLIIKPSHKYEFIFSNPTNKDSNIKFLLIGKNDVKILKEICLKSYASFKFSLNHIEIREDSNIAWETNLPIARCITFEHFDKYFDVFHS